MVNCKFQAPSSKLQAKNWQNKIIFIVGPTAVGKTEVAVELAKKINTEIISCDSMQVYKGMDITTSKPTLTLRKTIPHHLMDMVSPRREYNVARYYKDAIREIKKISKRGKIPLVVGGTGLYMSILIDGIFKTRPEGNIRNRLYKKAERLGSYHLYKKLKEIDLKAASKIHPNDTKRIIRALEVFESTGKPISEWRKLRKGITAEYKVKIFCLDMERSSLYRKIDTRVEKMFSKGLASEVKRLLKLKLSKTAHQAIGIKELKGYFEGSYDLEEAKRLIKRNTRVYAKRQLTWFRKDRRINWIKVGGKEKPQRAANRIWKELC